MVRSLCVIALIGLALPRPADARLLGRVGTALRQGKERVLSRLARAPRVTSVDIVGARAFHRGGKQLTELTLEVRGKNPNWIGVRASDVRWSARIPTAQGLRAEGALPSLDLPARGSFKIRTTATVKTGSLPADLIARDGTIPVALEAAMTARTWLGTVHFGAGKIAPLRSTSPGVPLSTERLPFRGSLGADFLQVNVGRPRLVGARPLRTQTPLSVTMSSPLGVPFQVVGGSMTVSSDGTRVGTASIPAGAQGYTIQRQGRASSTMRLPLVAEHTSVSGTLDQIGALLTTTGRGGHTLTLKGQLDVRPVAGGSLGRIRQIPIELELQQENFASR